MNHNDVVVLGSANADLVIAVDRRPDAGETVLGGDVRVLAGGKGANQAVAAGRLGARVSFIGCVGDDDHGRLLRASLVAAGVDVTWLRVGDNPTGTAVVLITPDGDNSIVVSPGANARVSSRDVEAARAVLGSARVLVLQRETDPAVSADAAAITEAAGGRVVLSLAPSGPVPQRLLATADPILVNEQEARDLIATHPAYAAAGAQPALGAGAENGHSGEELARTLLRTGARSVVVTLGAAGAVAADSRGVARVASPVVEAVDTTGAGDALAGALAHRLAAGDDLTTALRFAVRVAAISVTRPGAQPSYPSQAELHSPAEPAG
ncbi:MAG TPA: ribokinase [Kineosporiaceae bacterium]|nr:ribokinase [Kineosporiaceae bacterium]